MQALKKGEIPATIEILTATQRLNEYLMISLRTSKGIKLENIESNFGADFRMDVIRQAAKHLENGTLLYENNSLLLTDKGKLFADGIAADLFF